MHITIGVITGGRTQGLERLLESLESLSLPDARPDLEVLVVDNHPQRLARAVCDRFRGRLPVRHEVEPRRGIPFARNAVIAAADPATDFIAFVDDDQTVDPDWLAELLAVQRRTGADVVTGPAVPRLPEDAPRWIAGSGAFDLLRFPTGSPRPFAFTHNVLTSTAVFRAVTPHFDERLVDTGGSDTHFYRRVREAGFSIVWADEAVAWEWIPIERVRVRWLLQRALRIGGTDAFIERDLAGRWRAWSRLPVRAGRYAVRGVVRAASAPVRGRAALLAGARDVAHAAGLLAGLMGWRYPEYRVGR
jgi:succinoglycan biosynthesis protein ExoM